MARERDDDDDVDDDDRPARRRRRDDDDDDDDDDDRPRKKPRGPLDGTFADTNIVVLVLFSICCSGIAFILGLICLLTAKDPKAKSNAMLVTILGGIITALGVIAKVAGLAAGVGANK